MWKLDEVIKIDIEVESARRVYSRRADVFQIPIPYSGILLFLPQLLSEKLAVHVEVSIPYAGILLFLLS